MLTTLRGMTKWLLGIVLVAFFAMIFFDWGMQAGRWGSGPTHAAVANGEEIPLEAFEARLRAALDGAGSLSDTDRKRVERAVLEQMIRETLVRAEADRLGLGTLPEEVVNWIQNAYFRRPDGSIDLSSYTQALRSRPSREWRAIEGDVRYRLDLAKVERYVAAGRGAATEAELRDYYEWKYEMAVVRHVVVEPGAFVPVERAREEYEARADSFLIPERVSLRHILWEVPRGAPEGDRFRLRATAEEARLQLASGRDFDRLFEAVTDDTLPFTHAEDLGWIYRGQFAPFETFAFTAPVGSVSEVIQTDLGFHVLRLDAREETHVRPFAEVVDSLRASLAGETEVARARAAADSARAEILAGEPFEAVARRRSTAASARDGGYLGPIARGEITTDLYGEDTAPLERLRKEAGSVEVRGGRVVAFVDPAFASTVFDLDVGAVSDVVRSGRGFHVIRVEERRPADPARFEIIRPDLEAEYAAQKRQAVLRAWVEKIRAGADVEYHPAYEDLKDIAL